LSSRNGEVHRYWPRRVFPNTVLFAPVAGLQQFLPERGLGVDTPSFQELSAILKLYDRDMIRFLSKKNNILDI